MVDRAIPENAYPEQWDLAGLEERVRTLLGLDLPVAAWAREEGIDETQVRERIEAEVDRVYAAKAANIGPDFLRMVEKSLLLQVFDQVWKEHLLALDHLRQGIHLRGYGQRDPLNEYKSEAFALFNGMLAELRERVTSLLLRVEIRADLPPPEPEPVRVFDMRHPEPAMGELEMAGAPTAAAAELAPAGGAAPAGAGQQRIEMDDDIFRPAQLTVAAGTKVTWVNRGSKAHTVVSNDKLFDSGLVNVGGEFSHTFAAPGTYSYHCAPHVKMIGQIVVK
jgi:preprotein translocase subunit SecA